MIAPEIEVMAEELGDSVILSKMDCTSDNDNKKWAMGELWFRGGLVVGLTLRKEGLSSTRHPHLSFYMV